MKFSTTMVSALAAVTVIAGAGLAIAQTTAPSTGNSNNMPGTSMPAQSDMSNTPAGAATGSTNSPSPSGTRNEAAVTPAPIADRN